MRAYLTYLDLTDYNNLRAFNDDFEQEIQSCNIDELGDKVTEVFNQCSAILEQNDTQI